MICENMAIDLLDSQLIDLLMQNANASSADLARQLNVSSSTVRRRIKSLLKQGIIRITAVPNLEKVGLPVVAFISLEVSHEKIKSVLEALSQYPQAAWVGATSGRFNVRTVWWVSSTEELFRLLESEIGKIEGIIRSETSICLQIEKGMPAHFKRIIPESLIERR
jgi:Lrp/AsnC family transcriptional regulator for asnA, asnC and gidA